MTRRASVPFNVSDSSNTTFTVLPVSTHTQYVRKLAAILGAADNITVLNGGVAMWGPWPFAENGGIIWDLDDDAIIVSPGNTLQITKGSNTTEVTASGMVESI
jgi:hypothetical protein